MLVSSWNNDVKIRMQLQFVEENLNISNSLISFNVLHEKIGNSFINFRKEN